MNSDLDKMTTPVDPDATRKHPGDDAVCDDQAQVEFDRFADAMDLDIDAERADTEDKKDLQAAREKFFRAIRNGSLVINDHGEPVFTPQRSDDRTPVVFHEPTGASLMAMDKIKPNSKVKQTYTVMADITNSADSSVFGAMKSGDLKVCMAILTLFLE